MDYFHLSEDKQDILNMSSLGLAYLGDAVYEVMVRSWLCLRGKLTPGALHRSALDYVAAPRQAALLEKLLPVLRSRGLKVGVIKHDGHDFTPDVPGTDSYRLREAGAGGVAVYSGTRYLLTEEFRLTEQDLLALFERHGYDLVLLEGFKSSGWPKIEVVRSAISDAPVSFQPLAVVGDIPGADFDLNDIPALADWIEAQMPAL